MKNFRLKVWGQNQCARQISLNSERVGFNPLGDFMWNDLVMTPGFQHDA